MDDPLGNGEKVSPPQSSNVFRERHKLRSGIQGGATAKMIFSEFDLRR